jgi:hypothetical protein
MHFDHVMDTLAGRHLVYAYASVAIIQGAYFLWLVRNWLKLNADEKKATKPVA